MNRFGPGMLAAVLAAALSAACPACQGDAEASPAATGPDWRTLPRPVKEGRWLRPPAQGPGLPAWGHAEGLRVGLWPAPGPRGLLRIYSPYLGQGEGRVINYIAVEPISEGAKRRGYSELEKSGLDGVSGKRFWRAGDPADASPRPPEQPSRGQIGTEDGVEMLRVWVMVEPFENGARPYVRLTFRAGERGGCGDPPRQTE
jgi:hypothetical protein